MSTRIREIPYNYTSFSDREIVIRLLGMQQWEILNQLRAQRRTGRSARMLFEVLGDIWVVQRNPFIQDDLLHNPKRLNLLINALQHRLTQIEQRADGNKLALELLTAAKQAVSSFAAWLENINQQRQRIFKHLKHFTKIDNIRCDGFARVTHVTDATDWRVAYPSLVLYPDYEHELANLVAACIELDLIIIPRGAGTGYTGGAIPLHDNTVVINTEKLNHIAKPYSVSQNGQQINLIQVEAGAITAQVARQAAAQQLIFAVDPTSQEASTIGGNIAMNAGGKKAVLWGTTVDNLYAWKMVTPDAKWLEIQRLDHNLGKIHNVAEAKFRLTKYERDGKTQIETEVISINATEFRRPGLGKDVTNKYLGGLPGVQKEGCDGLITSAVFVLYPQSKYTYTICLEFFGADLSLAVPAIVEIKTYLDNLPEIALAGMEHLDERYIRAVKYSTKAARQELPKMLLLIDITAENESDLQQAAAKILQLAKLREAEGFIAISAEAREMFWQDRKRTAAIAAHTNAFKVNEDVVIPLENLAQYNDEIERINIEYSTANKIKIIDAVLAYLTNPNEQFNQLQQSLENTHILQQKMQAAINHLQAIREYWLLLMDNLDQQASDIAQLSPEPAAQQISIFKLLQSRKLRISYRNAVSKVLDEIFIGQLFSPIRNELHAIHSKLRSSRLFVAMHMHAGDGNVHTNIPVHSNDYEMLQQAEIVVARIMTIAENLGGVISGEHGIGITKLQFLNPQILTEFAKYKHKVDPNAVFNRSKLVAGYDLHNAYTPSLRLLEQEALILEASALGELNTAIKDCLRCGKCQAVCNTQVARANLFYSPRNKILATGLIIEAFLYEEQTRRGISLRHFAAMNDLADHCTVCHKCLSPCPVNIDFGDVSVKMREILKFYAQRRTNIASKAAMYFLNITDAPKIRILRKLMIEWAFIAQRSAYTISKNLGLLKLQSQPRATTGQASIPAQVINFINKPMPANIPTTTMRRMLNIEDSNKIAIIRNPNNLNEDTQAVFYFPGCGSERLFSQIGLASLAALYELGVEVVLPPGYLCCGYPQAASGDNQRGNKITMQNRILFHRVANTLNYMDIKTVLVSCGTCMDQLLKYQFAQIFPDCRLLDIHEYLSEHGMLLDGQQTNNYLYHDPCHSPIKTEQPIKLVQHLLGKNAVLSERCCGEAGTFATARADIATQVRFRKQLELGQNYATLAKTNEKLKLLTSCPACMQGLSRYRDEVKIEVDYVVIEIMRQKFGVDWQQKFMAKLGETNAIEQVLL
jgi:FAD/FMN-containing dehydrogenase/Fe-S oxidoreductase